MGWVTFQLKSNGKFGPPRQRTHHLIIIIIIIITRYTYNVLNLHTKKINKLKPDNDEIK
jgi:hypothetical protein